MKVALLVVALIAGVFAQGVIDVTSNAATLTVSTASKNTSHPYFGQGFSVGIIVNDRQGPLIRMAVGFSYTFIVKSACNHPFFLSTDASGQFSTGEVTTGITLASPSYALICNGGTDGSFVFTPTVAQIGLTLFYQCRTHSKMGWRIEIQPQTLCNKYSAALMISNRALVETVVNASIQNLIAPASTLKDFFNGVLPVGSTDYRILTNQNVLFNKLTSFFGLALGCTDNTIPAYTGSTNMSAVHGAMPIGSFEFHTFNNVILGVMAGAGVTLPDRIAVNATLNTLKPAICNQGDCRQSFCDRYSDLLGISNIALLTTVVNGTFFKLVAAGAATRPFFNGSIPAGSTNFLTNTAALTLLATHLVQYFGRDLGCSDNGFPAFTGNNNMGAVHSAMPIGTTEFNFFNAQLIQVLKDAGVVQSDLNFVAAYLESFKPAICNRPDCRGQTGINFVINVVPKSDHPWTDGFPSGYRVDGVQGRTLVLQPNTSYTFTNLGTCSHPLYISSSDQGAGAGAISDSSVAYPQNNQFGACNGGALVFTPTQAQSGQLLYYQCQNHLRMGGPIFVGTAPAPVTTGALGSQSFCDKYSTALMISNRALLTVVVNSTVLLLVAPTSPDRGFFDGTIPAGSTNFLTSTVRFNRLFENLVTFFGAALGCTDGTVGVYQGQPDMLVAHTGMPINSTHFNFFVDTLVGVLAGAGVTPVDQLTARNLLNSFKSIICSQPDCFPTTTAVFGTTAQATTGAVAAATTGADAGVASIVPVFSVLFALIGLVLQF